MGAAGLVGFIRTGIQEIVTRVPYRGAVGVNDRN
jgi:hypothetical protein